MSANASEEDMQNESKKDENSQSSELEASSIESFDDDDNNEDIVQSRKGDSVGETWDSKTMESLEIRITRLRLEEEHVRRLVKRRPIKLPYENCKKWVQNQNMWRNKEEWYDWVDQGEGLSAYIPSDPEDYYTRQGTWVSWSDFLGC